MFGSTLKGVVALWKTTSFVCFTPVRSLDICTEVQPTLHRLTASFSSVHFFFLSSLFCLMGFKTMGNANLSRAWFAEQLASVSVVVVIKL